VRCTAVGHDQIIANGATSVVSAATTVAITGLVSGATVTQPGIIPSRSIEWNRAGSSLDAGSQASKVVNFDGTATFGGTPYITNHVFTAAVITVGAGGAAAAATDPVGAASDAAAAPPAPSASESMEGKRITVPFYVAGGAETATLEVGGKSYTLNVAAAAGDSGGIAMLDFVVPAGWDGTVKLNGATVAIAPRIAATGNPRMEYIANPYSEATDALPAGMTRAISPTLPAGMTEGTYYGLPAGVTAGTKLPMPSGVSGVSVGSAQTGSLPTGVTKTDGSSAWQYENLANQTRATATAATGGGSVSSAGVSGSGASRPIATSTVGQPPAGAAEDAAVDAGSADGFGDAGEAVTPPAPLQTLGTTWATLKTQIDNKLGAFRPLASGSIPTISTLSFTLNFGRFGTRAINIDLTSNPFPLARQLSLVILTLGSGIYFIKWLKV